MLLISGLRGGGHRPPHLPTPRPQSWRHRRRAALRGVHDLFPIRDILAHVHPSGIAEPSKADEYTTDRVKQALALVDIKVLDHIIVAGGETMSFAERGMI
jgi:hypothetical protein